MMENKLRKERILMALLWCAPAAFLVTLFVLTPPTPDALHRFSETTQNIFSQPQNHFESIPIEAKAVVVKDLNTGEILYEQNGHIPLPLASLTKVMTAIVTREYGRDVQGVFISRAAMRPDIEEQLNIGETFSLSKLIDYMMVSSSNDGAAAIALAVQRTDANTSFTDKMNTVAHTIGMSESHFLNETGLDETESQAGAYGSAHDVAMMLEYALRNHADVLDATKDSEITTYSTSGYPHTISNTNTIAGDLPNLIASKTGYTELAGGNLAVVIDPGLNRPIAIVVLGSSFEGRFTDVANLAEGVSKYFSDHE